MTELKPCPFCGGEAIHSDEHGKPIIWVNHKRGCFLDALTIRDTDEAVEAWNTRAGESAMPTNDERREVAVKLRDMAVRTNPSWPALMEALGTPGRSVTVQYLADLIEPEERTCHIEPLSLHEFFAGEKYILSSDARESAEDERFERLSRELEEDAHFTCSSCHALFGTREVANADYDILEDGTYEVSGVAPIIKFCPYCGARVVQR